MTVFFQVTAITANGSDYVILFRNITLLEDQRVAAVPVNILDDQEPEFEQTFRINLLSSGIQGGAVLGNPVECTVTITENDYPYGLIGRMGTNLSVNRSYYYIIIIIIIIIKIFIKFIR